MTYLRLLFVLTVMWLAGYGTGYLVGSRHQPTKPQLQPLSVTILDDGGAHIKVESKIVEEK